MINNKNFFAKTRIKRENIAQLLNKKYFSYIYLNIRYVMNSNIFKINVSENSGFMVEIKKSKNENFKL